MYFLQFYGFSDFFEKQLEQNEKQYVAKVVSVMKREYKVVYQNKEQLAVIKGSVLHFSNTNDTQLPKVGDFVILSKNDGTDNRYFIKKILTRKNELKRKIAGKKIEEQVMAVNVDMAFITAPLDEQFNIKRIQRIMSACIDSSIHPVVVITKSDLNEKLAKKELENLKLQFVNADVIYTSTKNPHSVDILVNMLKPNKTAVFIGSSGAGKSTLTNMILQNNIQKVNTVSDNQSKGRHTTTHRELFLLKSGGSIIDTPGIKEFGLFLEDEKALKDMFEDVALLATKCKFSNCTHDKEEGCAIQNAVASGTLILERLENYKKLLAENATLSHYKKEDKLNLKKRQKNLNGKKIAKNVKNNIEYWNE